MDDLRGTNAIVTGASRGIGVYIARALAREGVNLALAARSVDELEQVRREMDALGVRAIAVQCDVAKASDRAELIRRTEAELGPIDILINNALRSEYRGRPVGFSVVFPGFVNTPPVRPLIVLANIAPSIVPWMLHRLGYIKVFERVMDAETAAAK